MRIPANYSVTMNNLMKTRAFKTVCIFLTGSAVIHIALITVNAFLTMDFSALNFFGILDFDLFYPKIAEGPISFVVSSILIVSFLVAIFFCLPKARKASARK